MVNNMPLDAKTLADILNKSEYPLRIGKDLELQAKDSGLVIVYGASDDLMEFNGAINDEVGAYTGSEAFIDSIGLLPNRNDIENDEDLKVFFNRQVKAKVIKPLWNIDPKWAWTYLTTIPNETFEILEDGEPYCLGIVFALKDICGGALNYIYCRIDEAIIELSLKAQYPEHKYFLKHLVKVSKALYDIEWVLSGDMSEKEDIASIEACITNDDRLEALKEEAEKCRSMLMDISLLLTVEKKV